MRGAVNQLEHKWLDGVDRLGGYSLVEGTTSNVSAASLSDNILFLLGSNCAAQKHCDLASAIQP